MATATVTRIGSNITYTVKGDKLVIEVDLSTVAAAPAQGKKLCQVANSGGFQTLPGVQVEGERDLRLNLYAGVYPEG